MDTEDSLCHHRLICWLLVNEMIRSTSGEAFGTVVEVRWVRRVHVEISRRRNRSKGGHVSLPRWQELRAAITSNIVYSIMAAVQIINLPAAVGLDLVHILTRSSCCGAI
jgi:hypothetical protein